MAEIRAFPSARDVGFIRRHAARMLALRPQKAEEHLLRQIEDRRKVLLRRGAATEEIDIQMKALEAAVRVEIWRRVLTPGGAA